MERSIGVRKLTVNSFCGVPQHTKSDRSNRMHQAVPPILPLDHRLGLAEIRRLNDRVKVRGQAIADRRLARFIADVDGKHDFESLHGGLLA